MKQFPHRRVRQRLAVLALMVWVWPAQAQDCSVATTPPVFSGYNTSAASGTGDITVTCTVLGLLGQNVHYTVQLGYGIHPNGTQRRMAFGGDYLLYNLYCGSGRTQVWADGNHGTCQVAGGQSGLLGVHVGSYPVYGHIPGGQFVRAGAYTDNVSVLVLY